MRGCGLKLPYLAELQVQPWSPSMRGCGLKLKRLRKRIWQNYVTLYARVWIETAILGGTAGATLSPSMRGCGLKPK